LRCLGYREKIIPVLDVAQDKFNPILIEKKKKEEKNGVSSYLAIG